MDQEFANKIKMEWELEKLNTNMAKQLSEQTDSTDDNNIYSQIMILRKQNENIMARLTKIETKVKNISNSSGGGSGSIELPEHMTAEEFANRFSLCLVPEETLNTNIIYDKNRGFYSTNNVSVYIIYTDETDDSTRTYFTIDEALNDFSDIEFEVPYILDGEEHNDVVIKISYAVNMETRTHIHGNGFSEITLEDDNYTIPTENKGTEINDLNLETYVQSNIMYDWIYFKITVCGYDVDQKITHFQLGHLEDLL